VTLLALDKERGADAETRRRFVGWFAEHGYVEGRNLEFTVAEVNYPNDKSGLANSQASAVIDSKPDVILVPGLVRTRLFRRETPHLPIVFCGAAADAVPKFVANPDKPGGNLTGTAARGSEDMPGKSWEVLMGLRPGLKRIGDCYSQESRAWEGDLRVQRIGNASVARKLGVEYREIPVSEKLEFAAAALAIRRSSVDGLGVAGHWWSWGEELLAFLERAGLPAVFGDPSIVRRGGLLSFRSMETEAYRQGVELAVRVLKGEDAGSIPVRFVSRHHLAVNVRTARAMKLDVPQSIVSRADEVVR
jgi:putative ABC transport system substrate-binding protein